MILLLIAMAITLLISLICMLGGSAAEAAAFGSFSALYGVLYLILKDIKRDREKAIHDAAPKTEKTAKTEVATQEKETTEAVLSSTGFVRGLAITMAVGLSSVWFFGFLDKFQIPLALLVFAVYAVLFLLIYLIYRYVKKKKAVESNTKPNAPDKN